MSPKICYFLILSLLLQTFDAIFVIFLPVSQWTKKPPMVCQLDIFLNLFKIFSSSTNKETNRESTRVFLLFIWCNGNIIICLLISLTRKVDLPLLLHSLRHDKNRKYAFDLVCAWGRRVTTSRWHNIAGMFIIAVQEGKCCYCEFRFIALVSRWRSAI